MKKYIIAILFLALVPLMASANPETPACEAGYHWEGEWKCGFWGHSHFWGCEPYHGGHWEGSCVEDEPVEPEPIIEPVIASATSWYNFTPKVQYVNVWNKTISWLTSHFAYGRVVCSKESHPFMVDMFYHPWNETSVGTFMSANPMNKTNYGYEISLDEVNAFDSEGKYLYERTSHAVEYPESLKGYYCRTISDCNGVELVSNEFQL